MNFSLYLILFLIIGTVFFGLAFPFMIMFIGVLLAAFIVMWLIRLLRGGSGFTVYTSRGFGRSAGEEPEAEPTRRRIYSSDGPTPPRGGRRNGGSRRSDRTPRHRAAQRRRGRDEVKAPRRAQSEIKEAKSGPPLFHGAGRSFSPCAGAR